MRIRFLQDSDLDGLMALAQAAGVGVTTLSADPQRLAARIAASTQSVEAVRISRCQLLFFVLEDETTGALVGTSGIEAAIGMHDTWYNYRVGLAVHASRELEIYKQLTTLFFKFGPDRRVGIVLFVFCCRIGAKTVMAVCYRAAAFLFMAEFPERFSERVIAEMRGVSDENGRSPFWESLGRHFFKMDFARADFLSYVGDKSFIAELMPSYPIYTCLLSEEAQAAIGEVHPGTRPARKLLEGEGFRYSGYVDIFDAGPSLESPLKDIRAIRDSRLYQALAVNAEPKGGVPWLVSNRKLGSFKCALAQTRPLEDSLPLTAAVLARLEVEDGDVVRAVPLSA